MLHRHVQAVLLLITRRPDLTIAVFSLLFLPGVALHELSHLVMARLLRVTTGRISLIPTPLPNGRLQLGYVETAPSDFVRDALIGLAPLFSGALVVTYIGLACLHLDQVWLHLTQGDGWGALLTSANLHTASDFWLWFYLAFTISSTMLPSASDRRAWLPLALSLACLVGLAWLVGAGPWMLVNLLPLFNQAMRALAATLAISVALHGVLLPFLWLGVQGLSRVRGVRVG
jgi:hypothetical protein